MLKLFSNLNQINFEMKTFEKESYTTPSWLLSQIPGVPPAPTSSLSFSRKYMLLSSQKDSSLPHVLSSKSPLLSTSSVLGTRSPTALSGTTTQPNGLFHNMRFVLHFGEPANCTLKEKYAWKRKVVENGGQVAIAVSARVCCSSSVF